MRSPDARRVCQYALFGDPRNICGKPLSGRGRHRWCPDCAPLIRAERRKARNAVYVRRWRFKHRDVDRLRQYLRRHVERATKLGYHYAPLIHRFQKTFGDPACGPDNRRFAHVMLGHRFHGYVVYDVDPKHPDIYVTALSGKKLPVPLGCREFPADSPLASWVREIASRLANCVLHGQKSLRRALARYPIVDFILPHPDFYLAEGQKHLTSWRDSFPYLPSLVGQSRGNLGRLIWLAIVHTKELAKSPSRKSAVVGRIFH